MPASGAGLPFSGYFDSTISSVYRLGPPFVLQWILRQNTGLTKARLNMITTREVAINLSIGQFCDTGAPLWETDGWRQVVYHLIRPGKKVSWKTWAYIIMG